MSEDGSKDGSSSSSAGGASGAQDGSALARTSFDAPRQPVREDLLALSQSVMRRSIGSPALFAIVYAAAASAIYFSLGVVAGHALGLTPIVLLLAALLFVPASMTYAEGASLHPERGGSTVFARHAFNEIVSFIAGWAMLLDYIILIAVTSYTATQYLRVFWDCLGARPRRSGWHSC